MEFAFDSGVHVRLRREDCEFVKHDKLFSKWKILVGPSDWRDAQNSGRNGIGRYHMQNLPAMAFGPGVFELGVTSPGRSWTSLSPRSKFSQQARPPDLKEDVIPVYVGQAANMRARLQKFGQTDARFEPSSRSAKLYEGDVSEADCGSSDCSSPRSWIAKSRGGEAISGGREPCLFTEVFALGSSIAFRWAHTDSKVVAEQVASELQLVFDYAWNKDTAGNRRSRDILAKLFMAWPSKQTSSSSGNPLSDRRPPFLTRNNAVGIKVALRKPQDRKITSPTTFSNKTVTRLNLCFPMTVQPQVPSKLKGSNAPATRGLQQSNETIRNHGAVKKPQQSTYASPLLATKNIHVADRVSAKRGMTPWRLGFLRRYSCFSSRTRRLCTDGSAEAGGWKDDHVQSGGERRRPCSLSFNTWVKKETDAQRVHDNGDVDRQTCAYNYAGASKRI